MNQHVIWPYELWPFHFAPNRDEEFLVLDTGTAIPGGYTGKGITGTDTDTGLRTLYPTRTHTRQTHTPHGGYRFQMWCHYLIFSQLKLNFLIFFQSFFS